MFAAPNTLELALLSAGILGFRHGFDYDHIAAISDIASVQTTKARSMQLGLIYALGHATTVAALGSAVVFFQLSLPKGIDEIAQRLVGLTLLVLGIYVLGSLFRGNQKDVPKSRFMVLVTLIRWIHWKYQVYAEHQHLPHPSNASWSYDTKSVFLIGVVHGLGAETPSQLLIFLLAANLGGVSKGFFGLTMFLAGLLIMNTLMTAAAAGLFGFSTRIPKFQVVMTALTAGYSLVVGMLFLAGSASTFPTLGG
jgi:hypothetical protein